MLHNTIFKKCICILLLKFIVIFFYKKTKNQLTKKFVKYTFLTKFKTKNLLIIKEERTEIIIFLKFPSYLLFEV